MTTTKKTSAAKAVKKTATKKPVKASAKKSKKVSVSRVLGESFRPVKETDHFFTFRFTEQSLYWTILSLVILALGLWVVKLHIEVQDILNKIDENEAISSSLVMPTKKIVSE